MSPQAEGKRRVAVKVADTLNMIEGIPVSDYAKELSSKWVKGEISGEEMRSRLIAAHKKVTQ